MTCDNAFQFDVSIYLCPEKLEDCFIFKEYFIELFKGVFYWVCYLYFHITGKARQQQRYKWGKEKVVKLAQQNHEGQNDGWKNSNW
jgi:hypothetical protein